MYVNSAVTAMGKHEGCGWELFAKQEIFTYLWELMGNRGERYCLTASCGVENALEITRQFGDESYIHVAIYSGRSLPPFTVTKTRLRNQDAAHARQPAVNEPLHFCPSPYPSYPALPADAILAGVFIWGDVIIGEPNKRREVGMEECTVGTKSIVGM
jgi:hypothetical protein